MNSQIIDNLIQFSEGALSIAERAIQERDTAVNKAAALGNDQVMLQKVASTRIDETLDAMAAANFVPAQNREKLASMLATHEGALNIVEALVYQSISPASVGEPVARTMKVAGASGDSDDTGGELAMFAKLVRDGFN